MKRMLRWRTRRHVAALLALAMTLPMGEGLFTGALTRAATAGPARKQSVLVFEVVNKSGQGGGSEGLGGSLTRQLCLELDQSPLFAPIRFPADPRTDASIQRALREQRLEQDDLTTTPDEALGRKLAQAMGADYAVVAQMGEGDYVYDEAAKKLTLTVTATFLSASGEKSLTVNPTGVGSGEGLQGALQERAQLDVVRQLVSKFTEHVTGKPAAGAGRPAKSGVRKKSPWVYVLAGLVVAGVAVAVSGGKGGGGGGPAAPGALTVAATRDGVRLAWAPSSDAGTTAYRVYRAVTSGPARQVPTSGLSYAFIAEVPSNQLQFEDQPPSVANIRYVYRVVPVSGGKEGQAVVADRAIAPGEPNVVTGVQVAVNQRTVQLTWPSTGQDFITGYRIYRSSSAATGFVKVGETPAATRTFQDGGLAGGQTYFYKVTAVGTNNQESDLAATLAVSASSDVRPSAPRGVVATTTVGRREVVISWRANPEPDVQYYQVFRGFRRLRAADGGLPISIWAKGGAKMPHRGGPYQILADRVTGTSVVDTSVEFNNVYYYVVRAVSALGESPNSDEVSATPNKVPGTVQGVTAQAGDGMVTVRWSPLAESDIAGYFIYRQPADGTTKTRLNDTPVTATQYVDRLVTNDTSYLYFVTGIDAAGLEGLLSVPAGPVTPTAPPEAPKNVRAAAGNGKVTLLWDRNTESNLKEYRVYRADSPTMTPQQIAVVGKADSMFVDDTAQNQVTYYYQLTAVNTSGVESARAPVPPVSATPDVPPATPENVQVQAGDRSVTVTWNPVTRRADGRELPVSLLRGYRVYRTVATTGVRTLVKELTLADLAGRLRYEDRLAPQGVGLLYGVSAIMVDSRDGILESDLGVPADPTPVVVARRLPAPAGFAAAPDDSKVILTWSASTDPSAFAYAIYGSESETGPFTRLFLPITPEGQPVIPRTTTRFEVTPLVWSALRNDTKFWFRIAAVDQAGLEGTPSDPPVMVIPNPVPPPPVNVRATNTVNNEVLDMAVEVTWVPPVVPPGGRSIAGYRVLRATSAAGPFQNITPTPVAASATPSFRDLFRDQYTTPADAKGKDFYYQVVTLVEYPVAGLVASQPATAPSAARAINLPPGQVQNFTAAVQAGVVTLRWDLLRDVQGNLVKDIASYRIGRRERGSAVETEITVAPDVNVYFETDTLKAGTTYTYRVRAVDLAGDAGPWSVEKDVTP